jgi:hypothetical protein
MFAWLALEHIATAGGDVAFWCGFWLLCCMG